MNLSGLFIIILVVGLFGIGFNILMQDEQGILQTNYNTTMAHSSGNEQNYSFLFGNITEIAEEQRGNVTTMHDTLSG